MKPTFSHRAEYYSLRGTVAALRALPWETAGRIGARLGALGYRPFGIRKRVVEKQIAGAFPEWPPGKVKRVALARLAVPNIPSIQVDWSLYGPKLAQVALTVGADDVDAVSAEDDTGQGPRRAPLEEIRRNIRSASLEPVERNGRFDVVPQSRKAPSRQEQDERPR